MKFFGNKKNGRYAPGNRGAQTPHPGSKNEPNEKAVIKRKRSFIVLRILIAILAVILAILVVFYIILKLGVKQPPVNEVPKPTSSGSAAEETGASAEPTVQPVRVKTKFTFIILGMDDGFGNTDTMMLATFDSENYTLNVVSIPRDTLVNVSWPIKKANSLYAYGGMEKVSDGMTALLGYKADYYIKVDMEAFSKLVNAIGGVYFDVPKDMYYPDPSQNLLIDLKKGPQTLDGDKALQLVRARTDVWATGDIGRIEMQQAFLKAAAEQILEKKSSIKLPALIDIIFNDVKTDLTLSYLGWFADEFFKINAEDISFEMLPAKYDDYINGSYCTIKVDAWLNIINTKLNPFEHKIGPEDVSILTRDTNGKLYVTDGNWAGKKSWGSGSSSGGSSSASPSPSPSPSPGDEGSSPNVSPGETDSIASPGTSASPESSPTPGADEPIPGTDDPGVDNQISN